MRVQTDIGLLPEDWEIVQLSKLGSFSKGAGISREDSMTGRIPAVRYGELYTHHDICIKKFNSFISCEIAKRSHKMKTGNILFTASGETKEDIGKAVAFIDNFEAYAGSDLIILNPKDSVDSLYLAYSLNTSASIRQRSMLAQGDSVVHITSESIKSILIPRPLKPEQKRIAEALSSIDKLINDLSRTIAKKENMRDGAMEELLSGKRRLPGFTKPWEEKSIGSIGRMIRGVSYKPYQAFFIKTTNSTPLLRSTNVQNGKLCYSDIVFVLDSCINDNQIMQSGDLLICMANGSKVLIGKSALFLSDSRYTFGAFMGVFRCRDIEIAPYIYFLFQTDIYRHRIDDVLSGSAINNLKPSDIEDAEFLMPSAKDEIYAIADTLTAMDDEIQVMKIEKEKYEQIRSGMMDDLLSGKIRLK